MGWIVVTETASGDTQLRPYVNEPVELNKDIIALVAQQITDALIEYSGREPDDARHIPSPLVAILGVMISENTVFPCSRCGRITARLIFARECASESEMAAMGEQLRNDIL